MVCLPGQVEKFHLVHFSWDTTRRSKSTFYTWNPQAFHWVLWGCTVLWSLFSIPQYKRAWYSPVLIWLGFSRVTQLCPPIKDTESYWTQHCIGGAFGSAIWALGHLLLASPKSKNCFFTAIVLARRESKLQALMASPSYTIFFKDKAALHCHPKFLTEVMLAFHLNWTIYLLLFFLKPVSGKEEESLHTSGVRRPLVFYFDRTQPFRQIIKSLFPVLITWKARQCQHRLFLDELLPVVL